MQKIMFRTMEVTSWAEVTTNVLQDLKINRLLQISRQLVFIKHQSLRS